MKNLLFLLMVSFAMIVTTSCKNLKDAVTNEKTEEASVANTKASTTNTAKAKAPEYTGPKTSIAFEESTYDFGKIMDGEKVEYSFVFKNTGDEPLVISNAKGSCGCTVPDWPKDPIKPGDGGEIKVVYNSKNKGKVGGKNETKTVTITANTDPAETRVYIKGIVDKKEDPNAKPASK